MTKLVETEIPDWAEWMAQDKDGEWYVYEDRPEPLVNWWRKGCRNVLAGDSDKMNPNWRDTLHKLEEKP